MIEIVEGPIQTELVIDRTSNPRSGAIVTFDGRVRNHSRGKNVTHLVYEAYPPMAKRELQRIRKEAMEKWEVQEISIIHRIGKLLVGESAVLIVVASAHRPEAFEACRFVIETLKKTVPIWKKEFFEDGEIWVDQHP